MQEPKMKPQKDDATLRELADKYTESETPFSELSRVKQDIYLRKANKLLRRQGIKEPITRATMAKSTRWEGIKGVRKDILATVSMSVLRVARLMDMKEVPTEIRESEEFISYEKKIVEFTEKLSGMIAHATGLHVDSHGAYLTGEVSTRDTDRYLEAYEAYTEIGSALTDFMMDNEELVGSWVTGVAGVVKTELLGTPGWEQDKDDSSKIRFVGLDKEVKEDVSEQADEVL